jgi:hypothetical protein
MKCYLFAGKSALKSVVLFFIPIRSEPIMTRSTLTYHTNGASSGTTPTVVTEARGVTVTLNDA